MKNVTCPKCKSENVSIQVITESKLVNAHHGFIWWICIGWWWICIKWLIFTLPALIFKIFGIGKKKKIVNESHKEAICQSCGYSWKI